MPVNTWAAGSDRMLAGLAEREARQRQAALDAQRAAEAQQLADYRTQTLDLQRSGQEQALNRDLYRANMDGTAIALGEREREAEAQQQAQRVELLQQFTAAESPEEKVRLAQIGMTTLKMPENVFAMGLPKAAGPDSRSLQVRANEALASGDTDAYQRILRVMRETSAAGRAPDAAGGGTGDLFMNLDGKTRDYLGSLTTKIDPETQQPYTFERALDEIRRNPGLAPLQAAIVPYLQRIFPEKTVETDNVLAPTQTVQQGTRPAAGPGRPLDASDQAAIARLRQERIAVTPQTIEQAKRLIEAGQ